jgi:separase
MSLDDSLIECFSALSPNCRTEELEDIIYFILDMYQFRGIPVAIAEVDISLVTVELQMVLESHAVKAKPHVREVEDSHLFLILGRNVQAFPWESIPILRGRSVSRIPNMDFLVDRLQLASCQTGGGVKSDRTVVNPKRVSYILNPSGDLKGTEERFRSWLKEMHSVGWDGVVGKPPSEQQFADMLSRRDLVMYVIGVISPANLTVASYVQIFWSRWCRAVHTLTQVAQPPSVCSHHAMGLFLRCSARYGGFRPSWNALQLHVGWMVCAPLWMRLV